MWGYLFPKTPIALVTPDVHEIGDPPSADTCPQDTAQCEGTFTGYASDRTDEDEDNSSNSSGNEADGEEDNTSGGNSVPTSDYITLPTIEATPDEAGTLNAHTRAVEIPEISLFGVTQQKRCNSIIKSTIPRLKRRKLDIPVRECRQREKESLSLTRTEALRKIEKLLNAKHPAFVGGHNGLQARRARAIHGYLRMLTQNNRRRIDASERAAEAQGFAAAWGGRQVRAWAESWIKRGELPTSQKGRHVKMFTLLDDPNIRAELQSYVRSNKWAVTLQNWLTSPLRRWFQRLQMRMGRTL